MPEDRSLSASKLLDRLSFDGAQHPSSDVICSGFTTSTDQTQKSPSPVPPLQMSEV